MTRAALRPGHVRMYRLIGSPENAVGVGWSLRVIPAVHGMTPFKSAVDLWAAVDRGEFPPPARGAWGIAWALADVKQWRRKRGLTW